MFKSLKGRNILVTGGTGFVGSHLVEALYQNKASVWTTYLKTDPFSYFYQKNLFKTIGMIQIDVCNFDKLFSFCVKNKINFIFHLAAQATVDAAYLNPLETINSNIIGTANVLEIARRLQSIEGVVVASSDKAYGKLVDKKKYDETDPLKGDHPYEVSKSSADLISTTYAKTYNVPVAITRFGNIYGEGDDHFSRLIPDITRSVITKQPLILRSDGKYIRDFLYVKDVVRGYLILAENMEKVKGQAFNFGSKETFSVLEVIKIIEKIIKKKINYKITNTAKNEIPYQSLDFKKINKMLGWSPKYSLTKTIPSIFKYYKKYLQSKV